MINKNSNIPVYLLVVCVFSVFCFHVPLKIRYMMVSITFSFCFSSFFHESYCCYCVWCKHIRMLMQSRMVVITVV
jgi:hypothetical protein